MILFVNSNIAAVHLLITLHVLLRRFKVYNWNCRMLSKRLSVLPRIHHSLAVRYTQPLLDSSTPIAILSIMSSINSQSSASGHNKPYDTEEELFLIQLKQSGLSWLQVEDTYNRTVPQDRKRTIYALQNKWRQLCRDGIVV